MIEYQEPDAASFVVIENQLAKKPSLMMPQHSQFQYRAWPSAGMPHVESLHNLFGLGVAEIRIDTYIISPNRPKWIMILRGGTRFEVKVKASVQGPVSVWTTLMQSDFPLRRTIVSVLQEAFPLAELPDRISGPADLISWLGDSASICTISKRLVHFQRARGAVELAQVDVQGRRAETFSLTANRRETVVDTLAMLPGPRLPDMDYGAWLQRRVPPPVAPTRQGHDIHAAGARILRLSLPA